MRGRVRLHNYLIFVKGQPFWAVLPGLWSKGVGSGWRNTSCLPLTTDVTHTLLAGNIMYTLS